MRYRTLVLVAVLTVTGSATAVLPATAGEWRSHDRQRQRDRDRADDRVIDQADDRVIDHHDDRVIDHQQRFDQQPQHDQAFRGTTGPYWGTMRPYWGPNEPPGVIHRGARTQDLKIR